MKRLIKPLTLMIALLWSSLLLAGAPVEQRKYLRVQRDKAGDPVALQTSITRFVPVGGEGITVDLIGVVHIADKAYYQTLNKQFEQYDVVLFELVAPKGTIIPKGGRKNDSTLGKIMSMARKVLRFESQLEIIDYTKKNFVHAESIKGLQDVLAEQGDNKWTIGLGVAADVLRKWNTREQVQAESAGLRHVEGMGILELILNPVRVKRMMAEQFDSADVAAGLGRTIGRIILKDRNTVAMREFSKQVVKGHKKIAIFYGAAHNADFASRLVKKYGMKVKSTHWLTAWDMKTKTTGLQGLFSLEE